jgi:endonuclease-3
MATHNLNHKHRLLTRILGSLKRDVGASEPQARPVLEQLLYSVCREGVSRALADRAFKNLLSTFFDWNEIRVSSTREIADALHPLPDAENRASRLSGLLQEVFETTFAFELESLHKKGLKQAEKQLERFQGANRYSVAYTMQMGLGGHSLPLDGDMQRTLHRLELIDGDPSDPAAAASLEHLVPKPRGPLFSEIVSELAQEYCHEESPRCPACPLNDVCPQGQQNLRKAHASKSHAKSRVSR